MLATNVSIIMRHISFAGFIALFILGALMAKDVPVAVRLLDVKLEGPAKGKATEPTAIASEDALAKALGDDAGTAAVKKLVNFKTEQVVYFAWSGSGQDKITFVVADGKKGPEVTFTYAAGRTRDFRPHRKVFVLPKDATFKVVTS
jgi:hypothetical protein